MHRRGHERGCSKSYASGIRSGCVEGWEFGRVIPAGPEIALAVGWLEETGASFQDGEKTGDGALGEFCPPGPMAWAQ